MQTVKMGGKAWVVVASLTTTVQTEVNGQKVINSLGLAVEEGGNLPAIPQVVVTGSRLAEQPAAKMSGKATKAAAKNAAKGAAKAASKSQPTRTAKR